MSTKRKPNSRNPKRAKLDELRATARHAAKRAELQPTHENLTRAFALAAAVKVGEAHLGVDHA